MIQWGPIATAGSAAVVLVAAGITVRQRNRADRKEQWWARTQWAMDLTLGDDEEGRVLGFAVLEQQVQSKLADDEDVRLLALPIVGVALPDDESGSAPDELPDDQPHDGPDSESHDGPDSEPQDKLDNGPNNDPDVDGAGQNGEGVDTTRRGDDNGQDDEELP